MRILRNGIIGFLALALLGSMPANTQEPSPDQPFSVTTAANVDENLFAMRVLAYIYTSWPDKTTSRKELSAWLTNTRSFTSGMQGTIRARGLDQNLATAYQSCLEYLSVTASYVAALDDIDSKASTQAGLDAFSSLWTAVNQGSDANDLAKKVTSNENAANAGAVVGLIAGLADYSQRSAITDSKSKAAIADQQRRLEDSWNATWRTTQVVARELSAKYGWPAGEVGFDGFQSPDLADSLRRYPRDPFIKAKYAQSLVATKDPSQIQQASYAYIQAAELVPAGDTYDDFRLQFMQDAALYAAEAAAVQAGGYGYSARPSMGAYALRVARTYLTLDPQDSSGAGRVQLARSLGFVGRYSEAVDSATAAYKTNAKWAENAAFCQRYAALLSLSGNASLAGNWLAQAYKDGFADIAYLRQTPDLASFRAAQPRQFAALTTLKWSWKIDFGIFNDDVIVSNASPFDLTNVTVQVHIQKGTQVWNRQMKCEVIHAGGGCKATNLVSIPGDSYDAANASLSSDQGVSSPL
jgi:hypothetical protein